ncbi:MAG: HutD family protein [Proteobacteria bacterium]|nr:HutD family protein [Pseudomonadota bacterium]
MKVQVLKPDSFKRMPWQNGRGSTTELHAEEHDNYEGPVWRISMADVSSDGPFSHFEGYDRTLTLVKGPAMMLHHESGAKDVLEQRFAMATFKGDIRTHATLHGEEIQDFNVFSLRHYCRHTVAIVTPARDPWLCTDATTLLVFAIDGDVQVTSPSGKVLEVPHNSLLRIEQPLQGDWRASTGTAIVTSVVLRAVTY